MLYIAFFSMIIINLYAKNKKYLLYTSLAFLWILYGWSSGNADTNIYISRYYNYDAFHNLEPLFKELMNISNKLGLSYQQYLIIISAICLCIISITILKLTDNFCYVIALYSIYPFIMDVTQVRQFIATTVIIFGFRFLLSSNNKNIYKYIICVIIAFLIHVSAVMYILLILPKILNLRKTIYFTIISILIIILTIHTNIIYKISSILHINTKISETIIATSHVYTGKSLLVYRVEIFIYFTLAMITLIYIRYKKKDRLNKQLTKITKGNYIIQSKVIDFTIKANIVMLILIPLLAYSADLYRIQHGIFLLNYIAMSYGLIKYKKRFIIFGTKTDLIQVILSLVFSLSNMVLWLLITNTINTVFYPFFDNNLFFNILK